MTDTAYLERTRVRLAHHEATAVTAALVTAAPVLTTRGWTEQATKFATLINEQWFRGRSAKFTALAPTIWAREAINSIDLLLSGDGPFYAELFTITSHDDTPTHSHACVWDRGPGRDTFAFSSMTSPLAVYATTRERDTYNTSSWNRGNPNPPTPKMLDSFIFEDHLAHPNLPPIDPAMFLRAFDVEHIAGTAPGDLAWRFDIPDPGTDITFDHGFPRGIWGHYLLQRRHNLEK